MHPIFNAIDNNDLDSFIKIFNENKESATITDEGWSIFPLVVDYSMDQFVDFLLKNMSEDDIKKQVMKHPLLIAIQNDNKELINKLIADKKISTNISDIKDEKGENALLYAQYFIKDSEEKKELISKLLELGCNPFQKNLNSLSPILYSIENSDNISFTQYLKHDNFKKEYDSSWIKQSIRCNSVEIFKTLFDLDKEEDFDQLFQNSLSFNHIEIANIILDSGNILPGKKDICKMIDLMTEVYENKSEEIAALNFADYLFNSGLKFSQFVNSEDKNIWTLAIENDNEVIFQKLIEHNEMVEVTDAKEHTPLFFAIEKKKPNFVKKLLEQGANVSQKDRNNNTPLIYAVIKGNKEILDLILSYPNTLINDINKNNESALSIAIKNKRMDLVSSLIWKGAEINKNPVRFLEHNDIYQIGLNGNYEKSFSDTYENEISNFVALSKLGFNLNQKNEKGDTFLMQFIKEGYLANFKSFLKCSFNPNYTDANGDSPIMCAMRKNNDDYSLGLLWKFKNIDLTIVNKNGENVYDIAKEFPSEKRALALVKRDENLTFENLSKVLPIIIMESDLQNNFEHFEEYTKELSTFTDDYKNNLLILSVLGNNLKNFIWILENEDLNTNPLHMNRNNENVVSLIDKLPEEDSKKFSNYLSYYLKKKTKIKP